MQAPYYPTSAFDYDLPQSLIALHPSAQRDESRLLVIERARARDGSATIQHRVFRDVAEIIPAGDVLVINETRVMPARVIGKRRGGGFAEVLLLQRHAEWTPAPGQEDWPASHIWEGLVRPGAKMRPGRLISVEEDFDIEVLEVLPNGNRVLRLITDLSPEEALARYGSMPLPPYIEREVDSADRDRYQTVYGTEEGSVAAPTAGLHFTQSVLDRLEARGVHIARIVLHVGVGTFRPVEVEDPAEHVMHDERYAVSEHAAQLMNKARSTGGKIWAVGTTVTRTLESITDEAGVIHAGSGRTKLFIRPGYHFRAVDHLLTNFHLPKSTLLMLVAAFAGYDTVMNAYAAAVAGGYRFYSYGDAMLVI